MKEKLEGFLGRARIAMNKLANEFSVLRTREARLQGEIGAYENALDLLKEESKKGQ